MKHVLCALVYDKGLLLDTRKNIGIQNLLEINSRYYLWKLSQDECGMKTDLVNSHKHATWITLSLQGPINWKIRTSPSSSLFPATNFLHPALRPVLCAIYLTGNSSPSSSSRITIVSSVGKCILQKGTGRPCRQVVLKWKTEKNLTVPKDKILRQNSILQTYHPETTTNMWSD